MTRDIIEQVRDADPDPGASAGWALSDEGRAILGQVRSEAALPRDIDHPRWRARALLGAAAAVIVLAGVAGLVIARDDPAPEERATNGSSTPAPTEGAPTFAGPTPLDPGPLADTGLENHVVTAIGDQVLYWSADGSTAILDPTEGTWSEGADAPTQAPSGGLVVWTGTELVAWGGTSGEPENTDLPGVAFDPSSGTWRTISPAPIEPRTPAVSGWDGREILVWGGTRLDGPRVPPASAAEARDVGGAAAYDPATDTWRVLESTSPGPGGRLMLDALADPVAWVTEPALPDTTPLRPVLASYSREHDAWSVVAGPPDAPSTATIAGAGAGRVVVVPYDADIATGEVAWAEWTEDGGWSSYPSPLPSGSIRCVPAVVTIDGALIATRCGAAAQQGPDGTWTPIPDIPAGKVLPLATHGAVIVDDEAGAVWWYR